MLKTLGAKMKSFLRGAGSVTALQPETRRNREPGKMVFTRTVFINGRKHQLDAKRDLFTETIKAYQTDWARTTQDVIQAADKLFPMTHAHASRRVSNAR